MQLQRDQLNPHELQEKSNVITKKLFELEEIKKANIIAFYLTKGSEVDTAPMIKQALNDGKKVLVPVTNHEIELVEFASFDDVVPAKFGVREPKTKIKRERAPDVIIIPGLAFSLDFHRLGYGRGYYDKLLKKLSSIRIAVCYEFQIVDRIPSDLHDEKIHILITEKRIMYDSKYTRK